MTKKDYEEIARVLYGLTQATQDRSEDMLWSSNGVIRIFAAVLEKGNPLFRSDLFLKAAGYQPRKEK